MPEIKQDIRSRTFVVAADDSLHKNDADYACDGVSDQVEINAALNALPAGGGSVVLLEGTFVIDGPIIIPVSNITLRGQGRSTFINGDGLLTGEHGVVLSGVTHCTIKKLAIQTQDGGGKTCHTIFIEDGANSFEIEYVTIVDSDSDGIHIEGTNMIDGSIHNCRIDDVDDYGIMVGMDNGNTMLRLHIFDNFITGAGSAGIALWNGAGVGSTSYCEISSNVIYTNGNEGIIVWDSDYTIICNNLSIANTQWGIRVRESEHVNLSNNLCYLNGVDGILLEASTECLVEGNICTGNTGANTDGIQVEGTYHGIIGNHCCENGRHGVHVLSGSSKCNVTGNVCHENNQHGIYVDADYCLINANYCYNNSQAGAGTYHGICLGGGADLCNVTGNFCNNPTAARFQESGIYLEDQCVMVNIIGNYCSWGLGSGIELADRNDNCQIKDNYCYDNDDYGIELLGPGAAPSKCLVGGNLLLGNGTGAILDNGALTQVLADNEGIDVIDIKIYRTAKNTSGAQRVAGDVVIIKGIATAIEFTTTVTQGDDKVYGMVAETIANDASGYVLVKGFTAALKVDGTVDIAIDDILGTFTVVCIAMKAAAGDQGFALALEGYTDDNSDGVIDAYIRSPWD